MLSLLTKIFNTRTILMVLSTEDNQFCKLWTNACSFWKVVFPFEDFIKFQIPFMYKYDCWQYSFVYYFFFTLFGKNSSFTTISTSHSHVLFVHIHGTKREISLLLSLLSVPALSSTFTSCLYYTVEAKKVGRITAGQPLFPYLISLIFH